MKLKRTNPSLLNVREDEDIEQIAEIHTHTHSHTYIHIQMYRNIEI